MVDESWDLFEKLVLVQTFAVSCVKIQGKYSPPLPTPMERPLSFWTRSRKLLQ